MRHQGEKSTWVSDAIWGEITTFNALEVVYICLGHSYHKTAFVREQKYDWKTVVFQTTTGRTIKIFIT